MLFLPDQLLEIYLDIKEAGLVTLGGKVTTIATVIVPVYAVICLILLPILYKVYKNGDKINEAIYKTKKL